MGAAKTASRAATLRVLGARALLSDPEAFDPAVATREMRRGLPDWRSGRWG
jgi:hypothetical protein